MSIPTKPLREKTGEQVPDGEEHQGEDAGEETCRPDTHLERGGGGGELEKIAKADEKLLSYPPIVAREGLRDVGVIPLQSGSSTARMESREGLSTSSMKGAAYASYGLGPMGSECLREAQRPEKGSQSINP